MNLQEIADLQQQEAKIKETVPLDVVALNQVQTQLKAKLDEQDRLQRQASDLEDITLQQDYNVIFGDPRANDEIKNLIRQAIEQLHTQHNAELSEVHQSYQDKLKASEGALNQLNQAHGDLKASYDKLANELGAITTEKQKLEDELKDALAKRDNAASQLQEAQAERDKALKDVESLKGQINELEGMVRTYKKPVSVGGLHLTSTLQPETPDERQARLNREEKERINARLIERGIAPLELPDLPVKKATDEEIQQQVEKVQEAAEEAEQFPSVVQGDGAGQEAQEGARETLANADAPLTLEGLEKRVLALEEKVYWQKGQVAS